MTANPDTAQIVSLAAVREAKTKQRTDPRNLALKPHDTPRDGGHDGAMTGNNQPHDGAMTGNDGAMTPPMTAKEAASNRLQQPRMIQWLKDQYTPEEAASVMTGALLLAQHIQPGEEFNATEVIKASVTDGISYRMLTDKCKPLMVHTGIWHKNSLGKFQWVSLKKPPQRPNDVPMSESNVRMDVDQRPNDHSETCKSLTSRNPINILRGWQRQRYLDRAKADVWKQVKDDGTVIAIPKPGQGAMTEKQKELHRKAAWADHEGKLKLRIDQGANKELAATIQREELAAIQQEKAILNQARILAAEKRAQRTILWERTKPLVYIGLTALIGISLYNGNPSNMQPMQTATMPPVQGTTK